MTTRRDFFRFGATAGAGAYLTTKFGFWTCLLAQVQGGSLSPDAIPKFVRPLVIPPAMPRAAHDETTDYYSIAVRQFTQHILPQTYPATTVWGYGSLTDDGTFNSPAFTIEATAGRRTR